MSERALRKADVRAKTGLGDTKLYTMEKEGLFPARRRRGGVVFWLESEIDAWLRESERGMGDPPARALEARAASRAGAAV